MGSVEHKELVVRGWRTKKCVEVSEWGINNLEAHVIGVLIFAIKFTWASVVMLPSIVDWRA